MHHESGHQHPSSEAIRDAVTGEDPAGWGHRPRAASGSTAAVPARANTTEPPVRRPMFSIGATFLGWAVAAFFTIVFSAIALALIGGEALDATLTLSSIATVSFIGYLIASFLAYVLGGYAAGRISLWNGTWHGLGTVAWAVLFGLAGALAGAYLADNVGLVPRLDFSGIGAAGLLAIVLSLLAMLAGGALGGRFGERYHTAPPRTASRRTERVPGRPLG